LLGQQQPPQKVVKVIGVAMVGFLYTLFTTVGAVVALRKAQGTLVTAPAAAAAATTTTKVSPSPSPPPPPFSEATLSRLVQLAALLGGSSLLLTTFPDAVTVHPDLLHLMKTGFFAIATVAAYVWGARLPSGFTSVVHPLVVASGATLALVAAWGSLTSQSFAQVLTSYKVGTLQWNRLGAGDVLLYLLGPAVVSFSLSMYSRRQLLRQNWMVVGLAMLVSSAGGLYGTAAFVRLIALGASSSDGGRLVRLSVLARNVTTALAIALTSMLGGDISICASVVVLTGIVGATYGKALLTKAGIVDPIARGLAIGSSSQGLGVASLGNEPDAFPFAAMGMVLTAIAATTLVSIPAVKSSIIRVATGA
jgi:putative effector of murein hydrolase